MYELMKQSVAVLKMTVSDFFDLEPYMLVDMFETARERDEYIHRLECIAVMNAVGGMFSKKYKYIDIFDKDNIPKEYTEEEAKELKNELLNAFK